MSPKVYQHSVVFDGDAFQVFLVFKDRPHAFFLDSSLQRAQRQFSYIGFSPFTTVRTKSLSAVKKEFDKHRLSGKALSFPAGAVGYWGYDGSLFFGFYDTILTVDHRKEKLIISSFFKSRVNEILEQLKAVDSFSANLPSPNVIIRDQKKNILKFKSNFTKKDYMKAVQKALEHIRRGDIYQINLSHQIRMQLPHDQALKEPAEIYRNLRRFFPSEFGAYFDDGNQVILSASPERFLKLQKGTVQVKPMKGTRPRGKTKLQDQYLKEQLKNNPKEIAELLMVTDLERNDLGRVCDYSTVKVKAMRSIEKYSTVFQATSTIEGRLREDCDCFDLLQAAFPSGSVTGCPKIEAMKIIEKLETVSRGLYTGALGYMSFSGDMDFNVMIRTIFLNRKQVTFHAGGGIVADSKPEDEWQETLLKAEPLIDALKQSYL